eukprot:2948442-Amphidinium_carterae.1
MAISEDLNSLLVAKATHEVTPLQPVLKGHEALRKEAVAMEKAKQQADENFDNIEKGTKAEEAAGENANKKDAESAADKIPEPENAAGENANKEDADNAANNEADNTKAEEAAQEEANKEEAEKAASKEANKTKAEEAAQKEGKGEAENAVTTCE